MRKLLKEKLERLQHYEPAEKELKPLWVHQQMKERSLAALSLFLFGLAPIPGQILSHTTLGVPGQVIVAIGSVRMWKAAGMKRCLPVGAKKNDPECWRGMLARLKSVLVIILGIALFAAGQGLHSYLVHHDHSIPGLSISSPEPGRPT
jgi:hypothetical protein